MNSPELTLISINVVILLFAYFVIYPRCVGSSESLFIKNDMIATTMSLAVAGSMYWGTGHSFNALVMNLNWFWFSLLTLALLEIPLFIWYSKKHNMFENVFKGDRD